MIRTKENSVIKVNAKELPIQCPNSDKNQKIPSVDLHPRIFIDVPRSGAKCAYCGNRFQIMDRNL